MIVKISQMFSDEIETELANPGENLKIKVTNIEEEVRLDILIDRDLTITYMMWCLND